MKTKLSVRQLSILLAVVRAGSIGGAARQLGLTQSGVSQAILALEAALGVTLFARGRDGVALSAAANAIIAEVEIAANALARIEAIAREAAATVTPSLRIATVPSIGRLLLPGWVKHYVRAYPNARASIFEGHHLEVCRWLREGVADLGFAAVTTAEFAAIELMHEPLHVVARLGSATLKSAVVRLEDLRGTTLVTSGLGCEPLLERLFEEVDLPLPAIVHAQDTATSLAMVRQGVGMTILPETAIVAIDLQGLRARPLGANAVRPVYLLALPGVMSTESVARFAEIVTADGWMAAGLPVGHH